ncbi:MAG: ABC transporter permease subunit [Streptosporangiales bacterium]|nr:ABC transporter permease subunit [Streptosporangiales bacterium]
MTRTLRHALGACLIAVPLLVALLGPFAVDGPTERSAAFTVTPGTPLGTDFVGRDVLEQVLLGGRSVIVVAIAATVIAYLIGVPIAILAATSARRRIDELLMRPLDVVLAIPSLLLVLLVASAVPGGAVTLTLVVAVITAPDVARVARAAALEVASRPAMEAMRLYGETWWRRGVRYTTRALLRVLAADAGLRLTGALYLVASASFLGVGFAPDASNWAVMVDRNRAGLFLAPWSVVLPALLIVALTVGTNLVFDSALDRTETLQRRPWRRA